MKQPEFTFWPWKLMALAAPTMAIVASLLATRDSEPSTRDVLTVFFGVLAAGNAYVFAVATGDFGRSVLAIPIGALAGFVAVRIFSRPVTDALYLAFLLGYAMVSLRKSPRGALAGCALMAILFSLFVFSASFAATGGGKQDGWCGVSCYPFVCACVTAAMPLEYKPGAIWEAFVAGTSAALYGLLMAVLFFIGGTVVCEIAANFIPALSSARGDGLLVVPGAVAALAANYYCVRCIFDSVHRVEVPQQRPTEQEQADETRTKLAPTSDPSSVSPALGYGLPTRQVPLPQAKLKLDDDEAFEQQLPAANNAAPGELPAALPKLKLPDDPPETQAPAAP
jgi:hypothetical protein